MPTRTQTHSKVAHGQVSKRILRSSPHYLRMSLNNPVQLLDDGPASWNTAEENAMIDYLVEHKAEAGDGCHFKDTTWTKVAECLQSLRTEGGVKTAKKCKESSNTCHLRPGLLMRSSNTCHLHPSLLMHSSNTCRLYPGLLMHHRTSSSMSSSSSACHLRTFTTICNRTSLGGSSSSTCNLRMCTTTRSIGPSSSKDKAHQLSGIQTQLQT
jgi:hypothetical protein